MPIKGNHLILVTALLYLTRSVDAASCGTGVTDSTSGAASSSSLAGPTDTACGYLLAGYYVTGGALPPVACSAGSYCPGGNAANGGAAANTYVTNGVYVANGGATACPTGTTNALTGGALVGVNAVSAIVCDDLAPGYAILSNLAAQSSAGTINALTTGITPCAAGYFCPGLALGLNPGGGSNGITAGTTGSTFTWTAIAATGASACPTGKTNLAGASSCNITVNSAVSAAPHPAVHIAVLVMMALPLAALTF